MTRVTLEYFALLRDEAGCTTETLETLASSLTALYEERATKYGFSLPASRLRVAVNTAFVSWDQCPANGDHIVFIPPVSGG